MIEVACMFGQLLPVMKASRLVQTSPLWPFPPELNENFLQLSLYSLVLSLIPPGCWL